MTTIWSGRSKTPEKDFLWELNPYQAFQTLTFRHFRKVHCSLLFCKWDPKGQKTEAKIAYRLSGSSNIICTRFWHSSTLPPTIAEAGGKYCTHHTNKNFCKSVKIWFPWQEFCGVSAVENNLGIFAWLKATVKLQEKDASTELKIMAE